MGFDLAGALIGLAPEAYKVARAFADRDDVRNLFALLHAELAGRPNFPWSDVERLLIDPETRGLLKRYLDEGELAVDALRRRLVVLCEPGSYDATREQLADEIVEAVRRHAHRAHHADRDATRHIVRSEGDRQLARVEELLNQRLPPPSEADPGALLDSIIEFGHAGDDLLSVVTALRRDDPQAASRLVSAIGAEPAHAIGLIDEPPQWVVDGGPALWRALGTLASAYGEHIAAKRAFERMADLPGADRARALVSASGAAESGGWRPEAERLLSRARAIDKTHVAVRVADAMRIEDPARRLDALRSIDVGESRDALVVAVATCDACVEIDDLVGAQLALGEALQLDKENLAVRDRVAALSLRRQVDTIASGLQPDRAVLRETVTQSLRLRQVLRRRRRFAESGGVLARAVRAFALAGDHEEAARLAETEPTAEELAVADVRRGLADAAVNALAGQLALQLLGPEDHWDEYDRHVAAHALALTDEPEARRRAYALAEPLLGHDELGVGAAFALCTAAADQPDLPWRDDAADALAQHRPVVAAYLRATRLAADGRDEEADALLQRHASEPSGLRALVDRALESGRPGSALTMAQRLVQITGRGDDRLRLAHAYKQLGQRAPLLAELNALASDQDQPVELRTRAYRALMREVPETDFAAMETFSGLVLELDPNDADAQWVRTFALARLSRHDEALAHADRYGLRPGSVDQALVLAEVYQRSLPRVEAIRRTAWLSDLFERSEERLEAALLGLSLFAAELAEPELEARVAETHRSFTERFPDSSIFWAVPFESPEKFLNHLEETLAPAQQQREQIEQMVADGEAPALALALAWGRTVTETISAAVQLPVAYGHPAEQEREIEAARRALAGGAVWDPTSLCVAAELDETVVDVLLLALPGSVIAASTLGDCDAANAAPDLHSPRTTIGLRGGGLHAIETTAEEADRQGERLERALSVARRLTPVADVDPSAADLHDALLDGGDLALSARTWLASESAARRRALPLLSDDRFIRRTAWSNGMEAFSTPSLLQALCDAGYLEATTYRAERKRLLQRPSLGLRPASEELVELAVEANFDVGAPWIGLLADPLAWRNDPGHQMRLAVTLLQAVDDETPDALELWTARVLDCAAQALPWLTLDVLAQFLLVFTWRLGDDINDAHRRFARRVYLALDRAPARLGVSRFRSLALRTIRAFLGDVARDYGKDVAAAALRHILGQLPFPTDIEVIAATVTRARHTAEAAGGGEAVQ